MRYRSKGDRIIDRAHSKIAVAEMTLMHAYTDAAKAAAHAELNAAQEFLTRAVKAKADWDSKEHDDYEEYPDVT